MTLFRSSKRARVCRHSNTAQCTSLITIKYYCIVGSEPTKHIIIIIKTSIRDPRATTTTRIMIIIILLLIYNDETYDSCVDDTIEVLEATTWRELSTEICYQYLCVLSFRISVTVFAPLTRFESGRASARDFSVVLLLLL